MLLLCPLGAQKTGPSSWRPDISGRYEDGRSEADARALRFVGVPGQRPAQEGGGTRDLGESRPRNPARNRTEEDAAARAAQGLAPKRLPGCTTGVLLPRKSTRGNTFPLKNTVPDQILTHRRKVCAT